MVPTLSGPCCFLGGGESEATGGPEDSSHAQAWPQEGQQCPYSAHPWVSVPERSIGWSWVGLINAVWLRAEVAGSPGAGHRGQAHRVSAPDREGHPRKVLDSQLETCGSLVGPPESLVSRRHPRLHGSGSTHPRPGSQSVLPAARFPSLWASVSASAAWVEEGL